MLEQWFGAQLSTSSDTARLDKELANASTTIIVSSLQVMYVSLGFL